MTKTYLQLRTGLSERLGDWFSGTVDSGNTLSLADTELRDRGRKPAAGEWVLVVTVASGSNALEIRRIDTFAEDDSMITWKRAMASSMASTDTYEIHRFHPDDIKRAINAARISAFPEIRQEVDDETLYTREGLRRYALPSSIAGCPLQVYLGSHTEEVEDELLENENFEEWDSSSDPADWGDATALTLAQESTFVWEGTYSCKCTATTSAGTLPQSISDPTDYAGQELTFSARIYCETASRVKVAIYDGTTETASTDYHGGGGWEQMSVTALMPSAPTEVTVRVTNAAGTAHVFYVDGSCHLWAAKRRPSGSYDLLLNWDIVNSVLTFPYSVASERPLRLVGLGYLSSVSAEADEMEIDDPQTEILYAEAACYLYRQLQSTQPLSAPAQSANLAYWEQRVAWLKKLHGKGIPPEYRLSPDWGT